MRLPEPITPMSLISTPASSRAPCTASDPRSRVSLSRCLPNLVMWMPRIHTFSVIGPPSSDRLEAESHGVHAVVVSAQWNDRQPQLHAGPDVLWIRRDVDHVAPD